jgi:hypothetical protein
MRIIKIIQIVPLLFVSLLCFGQSYELKVISVDKQGPWGYNAQVVVLPTCKNDQGQLVVEGSGVSSIE